MDIKYHRILLKLTGELLGNNGRKGIDFGRVGEIAGHIHDLHQKYPIQIAIVIGGGNLFRSRDIVGSNVDQGTADYIGMMGTVMNALALQEEIERLGSLTRVMSALKIESVCEPFIRRKALNHLEKGRIVILGGGTGSPFFTTDTAAALKARELNCDIILKGTNVDGVYDSDPKTNPEANLYPKISYQEALEKHLDVLDNTAFALCQKEKMPIIVFNIQKPNNIEKIVLGEEIGTLVT